MGRNFDFLSLQIFQTFLFLFSVIIYAKIYCPSFSKILILE